MISPPKLKVSRVSIHVPTRGTTVTGANWDEYNAMFQSTFPRGERQQECILSLTYSSFNPRSHEGNDLWARVLTDLGYVSIHVPTRGTTQGVVGIVP